MFAQKIWRYAALALTISLLAEVHVEAQVRRGAPSRGGRRSQAQPRESRRAPAAPLATTKPELLLQGGHSGDISLMVFSPDGNLVASGGNDQTVFVWDVRTGRLLRTFGGFTSPIVYLEFSPDGRTLAAAEHRIYDKKLWNLLTGKLIVNPDEGESFEAFSPDNKLIVSSEAHTLSSTRSRLRDIHTGKSIRLSAGEFISFSPDGSKIIVKNSEQLILEDSMSGKRRLILRGEHVGFSPDGKKIIVQNENLTELWEINSGQRVGIVSGQFEAQSSDGSLIVSSFSTVETGSENHKLALWDATNSLRICQLASPFGGETINMYSTDDLAFSPNRDVIVTAVRVEGKRVTELWNAKNCKRLQEFKDEEFKGFSRDGRRLLLESREIFSGEGTASGQARQINLRAVATGNLIGSVLPEAEGNSLEAEFIETDKGEAMLVTERTMATDLMRERYHITLRNAETGRLIRAIEGAPSDLGIPHTKRVLALIEGVNIKLFDADSGRLRHILYGQAVSGASASFSADENMLISAISGSAQKAGVIWELKSGTPRSLERVKLENSLKLEQVNAKFNADESIVAGSYYATAYEEDSEKAKESGTAFWDSQSGRVTRTHKGEDFNRFILPGDVQYITTSETVYDEGKEQERREYDTRIRDTKTGEVIRTFEGERFVESASEGGIIATVKDNLPESQALCRASLWELKRKEPLKIFEGACVLAFSNNGKMLVVESARLGTYELWDARGSRLIRSLRMPAEGMPEESTLIPDDYTLAFGPKDEYVVASRWGGLGWWRTSDGRRIYGAWDDPGEFSPVEVTAYTNDLIAITKAGGNRFNYLDLLRVSNGISFLKDSPEDYVMAVGFIEDNSKIVVQGYYEAHIIDARTGRTLRSFIPPSGGVGAVHNGPNGKIITENGDGTIGIWTPRLEKLLARIVYLDNDDWLVVTPEGFFDGSPAAYRRLAWRFSQNTFDTVPVEAFFNEFYYPGLLTAVFADGVPPAPRNLEQVDRRPPEVTFLTIGGAAVTPAAQENLDPAAVSTVTEPTLRVVLEVKESPATQARPAGSGAHDVRLFRNGVLVKAWEGDVLGGAVKGCKVSSPGSATCETVIPVVAGENRLTAYGFNSQNVKSGDTTRLVMGDKKLERKGTLYILAIGVNEYANSNYNLSFAVADATDVAAEIKSQQLEKLPLELRRFGSAEVVPLFDGKATRAAILKALARLSGDDTSQLPANDPLAALRKSQPEDAVVIYFAGHGKAVGGDKESKAEQGRFYLIPHDMGYSGPRVKLEGDNLTLVKESSISDRDLEEAFEKIDAGLLLLIIDACNSGEVLESEEWRRGPMNSKGLAQLAYEKGMYVLTASQGYESAQESARLGGGHGFLTYALIEEGLRAGLADALPQFGQIELREWLDYAVRRVPRLQSDREANCRSDIECPSQNKPELIKQWSAQKVGQQPRVFYRREPDVSSFVIARAGAATINR